MATPSPTHSSSTAPALTPRITSTGGPGGGVVTGAAGGAESGEDWRAPVEVRVEVS
jgi:hypothetical protein